MNIEIQGKSVSFSRLQELLDLCKAEVSIEVNPHKSYYETPEQHMEGIGDGTEWESIDPAVRDMIHATGTLIKIQAYPVTPVAFVLIWHYDLESAIAEAIEAIKEGWPDGSR
jgi:hypothetical protein